jgi:myosin heavy subunit
MDDTTLSQDGFESIETAKDVVSAGKKDQVALISNLEQLINSKIGSIEETQKKMNEFKEMLDSIFENEPTYQQHSKEAKEAIKVKTATKKEILKRPDVAQVTAKFNDSKSSFRELKEDLSSLLQEYAQTTGRNQFELPDGSVNEIVYNARLVKVPGSR